MPPCRLSESALLYRTGGGVGTDLSMLRPKGAPVNATVDASPGCTAFMNLLSESTNAVSQAGRRGDVFEAWLRRVLGQRERKRTRALCQPVVLGVTPIWL